MLSAPGDVLVVADGEAASLPVEIRKMLARVVEALRRGQAITISPHAQRLTTQQAADLLGISRPTLVKLLESGQIPFDVPGRHRRIRLTDLLAYQAVSRAERRQTLRDLSADGQEMGLYGTPQEDYEAALKEARAKLA